MVLNYIFNAIRRHRVEKNANFAGMKRQTIKRIAGAAALSVALLLCSCQGGRTAVRISGDETYQNQYAKGYSILSTDGASTVLEIRNPWQGAEDVVSQLFISRNGETPPEGFAGITVEAPLKKVICFSSTHIAFLSALDATDIVAGVSGAGYISDKQIQNRYEAGTVRDIGYDSNVNYELLASLQPDLVFIYGVGGENTSITDKFRELRIPFVYIGDYLENDPLGKAEWIIPFGELIDKREEATALFTTISGNYESLKKEASTFDVRPKVMLNAPYRDVWFVPGDKSYMVTLINDAGGEYIFAGDDSSVSRPVSGEAAYLAAREADIWLNPNQAFSIADLKMQNPKFTDIRCVDEQRVYNCTKQRTQSGGSDFWESGALYADRVLEDIILCLHPEFANNRKTENGENTCCGDTQETGDCPKAECSNEEACCSKVACNKKETNCPHKESECNSKEGACCNNSCGKTKSQTTDCRDRQMRGSSEPYYFERLK